MSCPLWGSMARKVEPESGAPSGVCCAAMIDRPLGLCSTPVLVVPLAIRVPSYRMDCPSGTQDPVARPLRVPCADGLLPAFADHAPHPARAAVRQGAGG